ncbi:MAG: DNA polymerase III PolC-type [Mycoplasmataceae bacterium]|nr:MAG: DNA polymerase III PolC-type [Mycoplasmataceae bacterium]
MDLLDNLKKKDEKWSSVNLDFNDSFLNIESPFVFDINDLSDLFSYLNNEYNLENLDWKIRFLDSNKNNIQFSKENFSDYVKFLSFNHFIWKKNKNLSEIFLNKSLFSNFSTINNRIVFENISEEEKEKIVSELLILKDYLKKIGLEDIELFIGEENISIKKEIEEKKSNKVKKESLNKWIVPSPSFNEKFNSEEFKRKISLNDSKLSEFSVHTKFSTLDGISSPLDYVKISEEKEYKALVVTDHNNVQSFPEFWEARSKNKDLKIVYGCEFEMLEESFPDFLLLKDNIEDIFKKSINEITYCIFDVETTGLFSTHDEIIDFGYVIVKGKEILSKSSYLIKPSKNVSEFIYKLTSIDREELDQAPLLAEVLPQVKEDWENHGVEVLVSHNARKFDLPFLNKSWIEVFGEEFNYPAIDTLPLSWLAIPGKKSYSLEKLSSQGKKKVEQTHRALDDSLLLKTLFEKIIKIANEKEFLNWNDFKSLIQDKFYYRGLGTRIVVLPKNKKGLSDLYKLVKISHVDNFFKLPLLFRSDVERYRENLLIGATGDFEGEIFSLFNTFNLGLKVEEKMKFYDYLEVRGLDCFSHFLATQRIDEDELKSVLFSIIKAAKKIGIKVVATNNVHYCTKNQKKLKEIIVANEGMNGSRHSLYYYATSEFLEDGFDHLPEQHLRSKDEIIDNWKFLQDEKLIEEIVFINPDKILKKISDVKIFEKHIGYPSSRDNETELMKACHEKLNKMFNNHIPSFVNERVKREWKTIKKDYLAVYWISWKIVAQAQKEGSIVGSRGSVGCSLIAYLLGITDINPLPLYSVCEKCKTYKKIENHNDEASPSCYDFQEEVECTDCKTGILRYEGHSLPFETFVGWNGEKTPDIDLNFSGEYQRIAHNHVRELLGEQYVYRIGTINKLSQQTAENFWDGHQKLRKNLNPNFNFRMWCVELSNGKRLDDVKEVKDIAIEQLKGIKRTTGQHPGGLLVVPSDLDILDFTPLNYPADDSKSEWNTTHFEYSFLSNIFLKLDILGHDEPTILQKFFTETGHHPLDEKVVRFDDKKVMEVFTNCDTLGIPEFGTDLVKRSLLEPIRPTKFSQLVQISGFSHGTDVWLQNQQSIYKDRKLSLDKLLACREDILNMLDSKGVDKKSSFDATEFIRKGKWAKLDEEIKNKIKSKLTGEEGDIYFSILEKIKYIFPKPHAIAYTMTAWRTAYYKVYFPEVFYSILLTYHATVYDIWLMSFDTKKTIPFHLNKIIDSLETLKASRKEFISISKVLIKLAKEEPDLKDFVDEVFSISKSYYELLNISSDFEQEELEESYNSLICRLTEKKQKSIERTGFRKNSIDKDIDLINLAYRTLSDKGKKSVYDNNLQLNKKIRENFTPKELSDWKLTMKEKDLLFTLRVISEIKRKGFKFEIGIDFNDSDITNFKFKNGKMLIPFSAITGVGDAVSAKIIDYRSEKGSINDWKEDIKDIINKKVYEQFLNLENNNLIIRKDV